MFSSRLVLSLPKVVTLIDGSSNVIYENGIAKKLLTDEGYVDLTTTTPTYYYYLKDHQGNNRVVINSSGTVQETNHYYPFGGLFSTSTNVQPYKYNGKELDTKKGLNLYDYGARHYDAALGRWHVVDPMAEKYGALSPYGYCANNPIKYVDFNGKEMSPFFDYNGNFLGVDNNGFEGQIKITTETVFKSMDSTGNYEMNGAENLQDVVLSASALSNIYTTVLTEKGYDLSNLSGGMISVIGDMGDFANNPNPKTDYALTDWKESDNSFRISVNSSVTSVRKELNTVENIQSALGDHELIGHGINKWGSYNNTHHKVYEYQIEQPVFNKTTEEFQMHILENETKYLNNGTYGK